MLLRSPDELAFEAARHEYRLHDAVLPGVTAVLEPLQYLDGIPWSVLKAAREFGSHVHQACDLWNRKVLDEDALDAHLKPYLDGWKAFLSTTGVEVIASELRVYDHDARYAGTLDAVIRWNSRFHVVDIKSGAVPKTVGPQLAAYRHAALKAVPKLAPTGYCVQLTGNGAYKLHRYVYAGGDYNLFLSALNIWHWKRKHDRPC